MRPFFLSTSSTYSIAPHSSGYSSSSAYSSSSLRLLLLLLLMAHRWEQYTLLGNNVECVVRVTRTRCNCLQADKTNKALLLHRTSQRSLHDAPIFRLLLKVAVNGTHQCDFPNFCGAHRLQQCDDVTKSKSTNKSDKHRTFKINTYGKKN